MLWNDAHETDGRSQAMIMTFPTLHIHSPYALLGSSSQAGMNHLQYQQLGWIG